MAAGLAAGRAEAAALVGDGLTAEKTDDVALVSTLTRCSDIRS